MRSNCLWYALDQWLFGGALSFVKSVHWFMPHVQHVDKAGVLTQFVPHGDLDEAWYSLFGFKGIVEIGDSYSSQRGKVTPLGMLVGTIVLFISGGVWFFTRCATGWSIPNYLGEKNGLDSHT